MNTKGSLQKQKRRSLGKGAFGNTARAVRGKAALAKSALKIGICLLMSVCLSTTMLGCSMLRSAESNTTEGIETQVVAQQDLVNESKAKFDDEKYDFLPALENLPRDHQFNVKVEFDTKAKPEFEEYSQIVGFYADAEFNTPLAPVWDITQTGDLGFEAVISAPRQAPLAITSTVSGKFKPTGAGDEKISTKPQDEFYLDFKGEMKDWGNAPRYYMVQWIDLKTGEKLKKPIVQIFTVQTELAAPQSEVFVDDRGYLSLRWQPVEGATNYVIAQESYYQGDGRAHRLETVDYLESSITEWHALSNMWFRTAQNSIEDLGVRGLAKGETIKPNDVYDLNIAVIAVGESGHSAAGVLHNTASMANKLTFSLAATTAREEGLTKPTVTSIDRLPAQLPVLMCDGSIVYKTIEYNFSSAVVVSESLFVADGQNEDGSFINPRNESRDVLKVSYQLSKTNIVDVYGVENPPAAWEQELAKVKARQDALGRAGIRDQIADFIEQRKGEAGTEDESQAEGDEGDGTAGGSGDGATGDSGGEGDETGKGGSTEGTTTGEDSKTDSGTVETIGTEVFATNALSNYLATNLLAGKENISLKDFPEAQDTVYLLDVYGEALYQNPLILGVGDLYMDSNSNLLVEYEDTGKDRLIKQNLIKTKVSEIIAQIIKDDMTDIEKEIAINQYLCDTIEYDVAAYENGKKNDFKTVDKEFNDTFTAYGALVNGVCVCAGYAAGFKLLADAAGLDSVVVTGTWAGGVGHAWNRVLINKEWISVDSTNNDNPQLFNALFNLPDSVSEKVLVEDKKYMTDNKLGEYNAEDDSYEYYRFMGDYFSLDEIADQLAAGIAESGTVTLRTDYNLDDTQLAQIAQKVAEKIGTTELYAGSMLGVITLTTDPSVAGAQ